LPVLLQCNSPCFLLVHPHLLWLSLHVRWFQMPKTRYILPLCLVVISCSFPIFKNWWVLNSPCFMDIGSNRQNCLFFHPGMTCWCSDTSHFIAQPWPRPLSLTFCASVLQLDDERVDWLAAKLLNVAHCLNNSIYTYMIYKNILSLCHINIKFIV
jgi:hypothetical protein